MSVTVELVLESLDRLVEMDDWLKAQAKSPVWIVMGQVPRRVTVGAYNVVGQPNNGRTPKDQQWHAAALYL